MENTIGERIAGLRKQRGWTQNKLAELINISNKAISKWESGRSDPSLELVVALSEIFDCTTDYLIKGIHTVPKLLNISVNKNKNLSYEEDIFYRAMDILKVDVSALSYELWLSQLYPYKIVGSTLIIFAPTKQVKDYILKNFQEKVLEAVQQLDARITRLHILPKDVSSDTKLKEAVKLAINNKNINTSTIQRSLSISYPTAYDIMMSMQYLGYVSEKSNLHYYEVKITLDKYKKIFKVL